MRMGTAYEGLPSHSEELDSTLAFSEQEEIKINLTPTPFF